DKVRALRGLHVLGTERHEARRIDNQLRGRTGRQGDSGSSRFYVGLDDELMRLFAGQRVAAIMDRLGSDEDTPIEHGLVTRKIENAQKKVEQYHFDVRKDVLEYDDVLNVQRKVIYGERRKALFGDNVRENVLDMIERLLGTLVDAHCPADARPEEWDLEGLREFAARLIPALADVPGAEDASREVLKEWLGSAVQVLFRLQVESGASLAPRPVPSGTGPRRLAVMPGARPAREPAAVASAAGGGTPRHAATIDPAADRRKIGRNDPCWCGSGKKYKKCHGKDE